MVGAIWSFLLRRKPIRDEIDREATLAVRRVWAEFEQKLHPRDDEHRKVVADAERRIDALTTEIEELEQRNAALTAAHEGDQRRIGALTATLEEARRRIGALTAAQEKAQRRIAALIAANAQFSAESRAREEEQGATSDLFCCMECTAMWLLSTRPDNSYSVLGPIGRPANQCCSDCQGDPLLRLTMAKADAIESGEAERVARPVDEGPVTEPSLEVPGANRAERSEVGVKFVADLLKDGPEAAAAKSVARKAGELTKKTADRISPATRCSGLNAIATGLDKIPKTASRGIAWVATEIGGMPSFPARVLGEVVTAASLPVQSLRAIARGIRIVGAVSCAADNCLAACQCTRHLVAKELPEKAVEQLLKTSLDEVTKPAKDIDKPPPPDLPPHRSRRSGIGFP